MMYCLYGLMVKRDLKVLWKSFSDHIKFTFESNKENINFLEVNINLSNGHLMTNIYIKPKNCHQYLDYSSSHPNHIKHSIVYSQSLRGRRLCSHESDFLKHCTKMKSWFLKRGYPENMIDEEVKKVKNFRKKVAKNLRGLKGFHLWLHTTLLWTVLAV